MRRFLRELRAILEHLYQGAPKYKKGEKLDRRILVWTDKKIPLVFQDWWEFADYLKQENEAGRSVTVHKWEYA